MSFLDEIDAEIHEAGLDRAVASGHTPPVFDWLLSAFSYQGISDRVARSYMEKHGTASWSEIEDTGPHATPKGAVPKLSEASQHGSIAAASIRGFLKNSRALYSTRSGVSAPPTD
jgi:hypothetical protein